LLGEGLGGRRDEGLTNVLLSYLTHAKENMTFSFEFGKSTRGAADTSGRASRHASGHRRGVFLGGCAPLLARHGAC
jgi:hypothetical protein